MQLPVRAAAAFGIGYRPLADADLAFIASLYASTRRDEMARVDWPAGAVDAFLHTQHEAQHAHYTRHYAAMDWLIIVRGETAIGRLYLAEWSREIRIVDIALVAEWRRRGLGDAILSDILALADARAKPATIHVEKMNAAKRLYERLGFRVAEDKGVYDLLRRDPAAADVTTAADQ